MTSGNSKKKLDMSPEAVTSRLELVEQLRVLCLELKNAKPAASKIPADDRQRLSPSR